MNPTKANIFTMTGEEYLGVARVNEDTPFIMPHGALFIYQGGVVFIPVHQLKRVELYTEEQTS